MDEAWFQTNSDGNWGQSLLIVPPIGEEKILKFLVRKERSGQPVERLKRLKCLKAYKFFSDGHVQKILISSSAPELSLTLIKASVLASMKQTYYKTYVALDSKDGTVHCAWCGCVAGKSESCNHVSALLFAVSHLKSENFEIVPDDKTCTDFMCRWKGHAAKKTAPAALDAIKIVKYVVGETKKPKPTLQSLNFDPRYPEDRVVNEEAFQTLVQKLKTSQPTLGFSRYAVPLSPNHEEDDASTKENQNPMSLHDIREACRQLKASLQVTELESDDLERNTRSQSASKLWHDSRRLRLTASCFHKIINMRVSTCPSAFLKQHLYGTERLQTKAMKLGLEREDGSAQRYALVLQNQMGGEKVSLLETGLRVSVAKGFLGASADRIATSSDGKKFLIELKNPDNTWEFKDIIDIPAKQKCLIKSTDGKLQLNRKHSYYTQIQGQMYAYGLDRCDFVLCTKHTLFSEQIQRDENFIGEMVEKLEAFYDNVFLPEVVYPRVKYGLSPTDLRKLK